MRNNGSQASPVASWQLLSSINQSEWANPPLNDKHREMLASLLAFLQENNGLELKLQEKSVKSDFRKKSVPLNAYQIKKAKVLSIDEFDNKVAESQINTGMFSIKVWTERKKHHFKNANHIKHCGLMNVPFRPEFAKALILLPSWNTTLMTHSNAWNTAS